MIEFFRAILFERPLFLAVPAVVIQFILIRRWAFRRDRTSARAMIAGFVLWPLLFAMQAWVVTDREAVRDLMESIRLAVERGDADAFALTVADGFEAYGLDKDDLINRMKRADRRRSVRQLKFSDFSFGEARGGAAEVTFNATADLDGSDSLMARVLTRWNMSLKKGPTGWRIQSFELLPHALSPVRTFQEVLRYSD